MSGLLQGDIAVVTGGGSGIGEAIALGYADQGASVAILDSNAEAGADTAKQIVDSGGKAISVVVNVTDRAGCNAAAAEVERQMGAITILVNNAGINRRTPIIGDKAAVAQDWDDIIDVNIKGVFNVTHAFLDQLRATKGRVVNIGSMPGTPGKPLISTSNRRNEWFAEWFAGANRCLGQQAPQAI